MYENEIIKKAETLSIKHIGFCRHNGKSAVCCLFPYYIDGENSRISVYARPKDYHIIVREKLKTLMADFDENALVFADTGPVGEDILIAQKCGLGVRGRNTLLINEEAGSWFFIGYALTDLDLTPSVPKEGSCLNCGLCEKNCPGGALSGGKIDISRCASHLTQKKGTLTSYEEDIIKRSGFIFGCDICQSACPMNKGKGECIDEFKADRILSLDEEKLSSMSGRKFMREYKDRAFSWRGKAPLLRNMKLFDKH